LRPSRSKQESPTIVPFLCPRAGTSRRLGYMRVPPLLPRSLPQQQFHLLHRPVLFTNASVLSQFPPEILSAGSKEATGEAISPARSVRRRAVSRPVLRFRRPC